MTLDALIVRSSVIVAALTIGATAPPTAADVAPTHVARIDPAASGPRWHLRSTARPSGNGPLLAERWFASVPDEPLLPLDRDAAEPDGLRGRPTVVDFWASWCAPCLEELPHLDAIDREYGPKGVRVVALNVDDPPDVARSTTRRLGLGVEVARPGERLLDVVRPRSLPTVLLLDDRGRIRHRWDGYRPGMEDDVRARIEALLDVDAEPTLRPVADVLVGTGRLEVAWSRPFDGTVEGVAVESLEGRGRILATVGSTLVALRADGSVVGRVEGPPGSGRLLLADVTGDGRTDVIGWRRGGQALGVIDMERRAASRWTLGEPVLDLVALSGPSAPGGAVAAVATPGGMRCLESEGRVVARSDDPIRAVAGSPDGSLVVLDATGAVVRVPWDGGQPATVDRLSTARRIVIQDGVWLAAADGAAALATARTEDGLEVVVADGDGEIRLVDAASGAETWRSAWSEGIAQLAVGDLDADGIDELVVASGRDVTVLRFASVERK